MSEERWKAMAEVVRLTARVERLRAVAIGAKEMGCCCGNGATMHLEHLHGPFDALQPGDLPEA